MSRFSPRATGASVYSGRVSESWRSALDAAIAGDPRPGLRFAQDASGEGLVLQAALARLGQGAMPELAAIEAAGPSGALAAALVARDALIRLDAPVLHAAGALALRLAADGRARIEAEGAALWCSHLAGEPDLAPRAKELEARASRARLPHMVIDAASLAADALLHAGQLEAATSVARRASRMARTEGLPFEEYLAHLILARIRRHGGRPHLATRILTSLARAAPASVRSWLALELGLSGAPELARRVLERGGPRSALVEATLGLLGAAARGDRRELERARDEAWRALGGLAPIAHELHAIVRAVDPHTGHDDADATGAFLRGELDAVPGVLAGVAQLTHEGEAAPLVRVLAAPGLRARRVLSVGVPLAGAIEIGRETGAKQHRRERALAILALTGEEGLAKEELFARVWGFSFVPHLHQGVLDVLLHRVRGALAEVGELVRREGRVALVPSRPLLIVDPRAERSIEDRVLRALALRGAARARELAEDVGMPLRTVQSALARLVEGEECLREGEGQAVSYRVEDTTFREPTRF